MAVKGELMEPLTGLTKKEAERLAPIFDVEPKEILRHFILSGYKIAEEIVNSENPLKPIAEHLDNIAAGERNNKLTIFVLLLSGKSENPRLKEMILLKSESGAGKSTLMVIAQFSRTKWIGRLTEHALDHMDDLNAYNVLALKELGKMDDEKYGTSTIKFLSMDDQGYTVGIPIGSPAEGFRTETKTIPPITVISGTTRLWIDPQYERRNWIIGLDESPEQTMKIMEWKARQEYEYNDKLLGLIAETSYERSSRVLHSVVERTKPCEVAILFPKAVMNILSHQSLRVRGDYTKVLNVVKYYGMLRQRTLPKIEMNGKEIVLVTPKAALQILDVIREPLILMTMEIDGRTKKMLDLFKKKNLKKGMVIDNSYRKELAAEGNITPETVRLYLNFLESKGYLLSDMVKPEGRGRAIKVWEIIVSPETMKRKESALAEKLEPSAIIMEMCKEAQKYLDKLPGDVANGVTKHFIYDPSAPFFAYPLKEENGEIPEYSPLESETPETSPLYDPDDIAKKQGAEADSQKTCFKCGILLNNETGNFMNPETDKHYCRQHWLSSKKVSKG